MRNINVVFDTNAYRNLTLGATPDQAKAIFETVRLGEEARNITSLLSAITLMELLAHLADKSDPGYEHCKIATIGAYHHVHEANNFRILPHPELLLENMLFGRVDEEHLEVNRVLGRVASKIHTGTADEVIQELHLNLLHIKTVVEQHEQDFINDTLTGMIQLDPGVTNWTLFQNDKKTRKELLNYLKTDNAVNRLAAAFVIKTINNLEVEDLAEQDFIKMVLEVARVFGTAFTLYIKVMERLATSGYDLTNLKKKRWNTIWDIYLLCSVTDETIGGKDTVFITEEIWLHQVCSEIGRASKIMKLADYKKLVGI